MSEDLVSRRVRRSAERLLEDERLQGGMTDLQFQPLLDWALAEIERTALATEHQPDDAAEAHLDAASAAIRRVVDDVDDLLTTSARDTRAWSEALTVLLDDVMAPVLVQESSPDVRSRLRTKLAGLLEMNRWRRVCDVDAGGERLTRDLAELLTDAARTHAREVP